MFRDGKWYNLYMNDIFQEQKLDSGRLDLKIFHFECFSMVRWRRIYTFLKRIVHGNQLNFFTFVPQVLN